MQKMPTKRIIYFVGMIASVVIILCCIRADRATRGKNSQLNAYMHGAAQNEAMMDATGFESEARDALNNGDRSRFLGLKEQSRTARERERFHSEQRKKHEAEAASILGSNVSHSLPPGVEMPHPQYYLNPRDR